MSSQDEFTRNGWPDGDPCEPIELARGRALIAGIEFTPPAPSAPVPEREEALAQMEAAAETAPPAPPENAAFAATPE